MLKYTLSLAAVCVLIVIFNVSKLSSYDSKLQTLIEGWKDKFSVPRGNVLYGYYMDDDVNLVVVESQKVENAKAAGAEDQYWEFDVERAMTLFPEKIKLIDGYDYEDMERLRKEVEWSRSQEYKSVISGDDKYRHQLSEFFEKLLKALKESEPRIEGINNDEHYQEAKQERKFPHRDGRVMLYGGFLRENYLEEPVRTKGMLDYYLRLSDEEKEALRLSHRTFEKKIDDLATLRLMASCRYNMNMKGDGIVYLGGGKYDQLTFLSIQILRKMGSKLPVEVIVPKRSDYDINYCTKVLPTMNAQCKVMEDYLPKSFIEHVGGFQYKNVALLVSSFKRVLYLDADNIPFKNPDNFFSNEPFLSHHLVFWPDFWRRSTSPSFYEIAGIKVNEKRKVRNSYFPGDERGTTKDPSKFSYHDCEGAIPEASSETGQLLINKEVHLQTLILSMYYNFYGPNFYYPLLSQGAAGEGDKETFIAAAHKLELPYYQVKEFNREFGPLTESHKHNFFAMGQSDPIVDFIQFNTSINAEEGSPESYINKQKPTYGKNDADDQTNNYQYHMFNASSLFFLHANWPKFYLSEMFLHNAAGRGPMDGSSRRRLYGVDLKNTLDDTDLELEIFNGLYVCYCYFKYFNLHDVPDYGEADREKICKEIKEHIHFLHKN